MLCKVVMLKPFPLARKQERWASRTLRFILPTIKVHQNLSSSYHIQAGPLECGGQDPSQVQGVTSLRRMYERL
jgi:hypothetical protein